MKKNDIKNSYLNSLKLFIRLSVTITALIFFSCSTCMALQTSNIQLLLDRDYFPEVKKIINDSNRSIKMIMFEASYYKKFKNSPSNQLIDALIKAKKRGIDVEVILDIRQKSDRSTKRNLETGKMLTNAGVEVTFDTEQITTHSKLLIIDEKIIVIGSTNWTYNALTANHESSIVFDSRETATELIGFFEKIKKTGKKYSNF
jgi:phosphatidylserine/phosphatidylglycerophosphate/cardiolipin synthase-like enzyme